MKKYKKPKSSKKSFSLVELVVFTGIFALFFVAALSIVTVSVRNMKFNELKIRATHAASELLEWVKGEKEAEWTDLVSNRSSTSGIVWCFNSDLISGWPASSGPCLASDYSLNGLFKREIRLTKNSAGTQIAAQVVVYWQEAQSAHSVPINTVLTIAE